MNIYKALRLLEEGNKLPRKMKKVILGKRISKSILRRKLKSVQIIENYPNSSTILPEAFCPKCGCTLAFGTGNMVEYPDHWEQWHCMRCGFLIGEVDNSPFVHCLEFPPDYKIIF